MTPYPTHEIKRALRGILTSELDDAGPNNTGEGPEPTRKRARSPGRHEETEGLSYHDKRSRLGNATAQARDHEQQRAEVLTRYAASYRVNRSGSGVFTLNKQTNMATEVLDKAAGSHSGHQTARPPETRQAYLREEREQRFRERKEYEIDKRLDEDNQWISEQAILHHMDQQGRQSCGPGQLPQGNSTEQHAHQDLVTVLSWILRITDLCQLLTMVCLVREYRSKIHFNSRIMTDHRRLTVRRETKKNKSQAFWGFRNLKISTGRRLG
ncbi:hypothetical protein EDB85DRAFT_417369 [Lactarius pseudohatsudake]|nr:hypothetical protein EDB85DRAFT_417369 [Lactarius pseudohatsudake]